MNRHRASAPPSSRDARPVKHQKEAIMEPRKAIVIDGCVTEVRPSATLAELVPAEVVSVVTTHDGRLVKREDFSRVAAPLGYESNLTGINKGGRSTVDAGRRGVLAFALALVAADAIQPAHARVARAAGQALRRRAAGQKPAKPVQPEGKPHDVVIHRSRHPEAAAHIEHAQRQGQPSVLHIDRAGAAARRRESTGSVNPVTRPGRGWDRDEYPPAFAREGGANANVRFIPAHENRGAGSAMGRQISGLRDGEKVRVIVTD